MIDSHCHLNLLDLSPYQGNVGALIQKAHEVGIEHLLCVGIDLIHAQEVVDIAVRFKNVSASVGLHPSQIVDAEPNIETLIDLGSHPEVVALGETGLDYYYNQDNQDVMQQRFRCHIRAAKHLKKPIIVHSRQAREDTIRILEEEDAQSIRGVMHCFTETWSMAKQALDLGFYISFSGIVTFKNTKELVEVAKKVPMDRLLIETDAPYLAPVPFRGQTNQPQYLIHTASFLAKRKCLSLESFDHQTTENYRQLFG